MRRLSSPALLLITLAAIASLNSTSVLAQNADGTATSSAATKNPPTDGSALPPRDPPADSTTSEAASSVADTPAISSAASSVEQKPASSVSSAAISKPTVSSSAAASSRASSVAAVRSSARASVAARSSVASSFASSLSSASSDQSSVIVIPEPEPPADAGFWERANFGYDVPVIDPALIARPAAFTASSMSNNALLALLITFIIGIGGEVLRRLSLGDPEMLRRLLGRLPLQAIATVLLFEFLTWLIPVASAQGTADTAASALLRVPFFAFLFLVVTGVSNGLLNALAESEGQTVKARLAALPGVGWMQAFFARPEVRRAIWFVAILLVLYGIVGAYINPQFSLFPSQNLGIILVAVITVTAAAYTPDVLRFVVAKRWKSEAWFEGNIAGLLVALLCVYLSRTFQLSPGYIYGLPVGLFLLLRAGRNEGLLEFLSLTWMLLISLILWAALPVFGPKPVLYDTANLLFIVLLEGVFFELLPLPSVAGGTIFQWRRAVWAALFFVVVFLLFQTLFHPEGTIATIQQSPSALFTLLSVGFYAAGIAILWGYMLWKKGSKTAA